MDFTYNSYSGLVDLLREHNYCITSYHDWDKYDRSAILRHDIDYDMSKAVEFAAFENDLGVSSTYFVLLTSDFYNLFSKDNRERLHRIKELKHEIGLHFDETCYGSFDKIEYYISEEKKRLEELLGEPVKTISMHRPSKKMLDMDLKIDDLVNSYGSDFFRDIKYVSDSRRRWREPVEAIIKDGQYSRLQILTHAFWYNEYSKDMHDTVYDFVNSANKLRYDILDENITDLASVMNRAEVR